MKLKEGKARKDLVIFPFLVGDITDLQGVNGKVD